MNTVKSKPVCCVPVSTGMDCRAASMREYGASLRRVSDTLTVSYSVRKDVPEIRPITRGREKGDVWARPCVVVRAAAEARRAVRFGAIGVAFSEAKNASISSLYRGD